MANVPNASSAQKKGGLLICGSCRRKGEGKKGREAYRNDPFFVTLSGGFICFSGRHTRLMGHLQENLFRPHSILRGHLSGPLSVPEHYLSTVPAIADLWLNHWRSISTYDRNMKAPASLKMTVRPLKEEERQQPEREPGTSRRGQFQDKSISSISSRRNTTQLSSREGRGDCARARKQTA
ncbi:hypothetical protein CEXT_63691 [Caerostris extrusa]|uniref:LAGLIDADG homing endonuclease n=1 Tax=Caerostris extrusa TaxID=172846 RepID=A0AAV4TYC0_CAEEX|nr:hypothetical protein CEXT_63691 [Caerostris extrusa]